MSRCVRIANCSGFYGDRLSAAKEVVQGGPIDVLTGDWLAELTMSILAMDQLRDPAAGFARTFVRQMNDVIDDVSAKRIKVVSNAGGLNPHALAERIRSLVADRKLPLTVAVVTGDDLREQVTQDVGAGIPLVHMQTGEPLDPTRMRPLTANAYLGCWGIAEALRAGADIVITGRVTDAAVVMGAAAWWHDWSNDAFDCLAGALAAGHVIECGCQATGGNQPFWDDLNLHDVGFPIAEIEADGCAVITKHPGTGGRVDRHSVTAQLLYEIGPPAYLSPDVIGHFDTLTLTEIGPDRVRLAGTRGSPPPSTLKLGLTVLAGHRNRMTAVIGGHDGLAKARLLEQLAWERLGGKEAFDDARSDIFQRAEGPPLLPTDDLTLVDFSVRDTNAKKVGTRFTAPLVELALATIPGITFSTQPGKPKPIGIFWPVAVERDRVDVQFHVAGSAPVSVAHPPLGPLRHQPEVPPLKALHLDDATVRLASRVGARSGDKGGNANVGFWVADPADFDWMRVVLTEQQIADWLAPTGWKGRVELYVLPNLHALNVVLHGFLGSGVAANLAPDPQAKCLAEFFRSQRVRVQRSMHTT